MPEATEAPAPLLEPPAERPMSQGLRVTPQAAVSAEMLEPHSGTVVRPSVMRPESTNFWATYDVTGAFAPASLSGFQPQLNGSPSII